MEKTNSESKIKEVRLKTKWYEGIKIAPIANGLMFLFFIGGSILTLILGISTGNKVGYVMAVACLLFYVLPNIPIIIKIIKPTEYVVSADGDLLRIYKNGKEIYSITSQETKKIVLTAFIGKILSIGIYKVAPEAFSSGEGKNLSLSFISKNETSELIKLLLDFYGEQRLKELMSR